MSIINATKYDTDDRQLLIRERLNQDTGDSYWVWCHPQDGSEHGTNINKYVEFATLEEATDRALSHGYTYEIERK
jgi:hypothetical protein